MMTRDIPLFEQHLDQFDEGLCLSGVDFNDEADVLLHVGADVPHTPNRINRINRFSFNTFGGYSLFNSIS